MAIKVLVISSYDDNYNAVRPEGELLIGLQQAGLDLHIMTQGEAPFTERFRASGLRVIDFHPKKKFDGAAVRRIRAELIAGQYDILYLCNNKAIANGLRAAWRLPVRVITYRGYAGHVDWWDPSVYLTHLSPRIDYVACVSEAVRKTFQHQPFFDGSKAVTVGKGHNPAWYAGVAAADLAEFDLPPNAIVVGTVANARKIKGIDVLAEALRYVSAELPVYVLFIGRNLDTPAIRRLLATTPFADRVRFTGFRKDALSLIKALDISVLPSFAEGLSKVVLESLFLGVATIMTDIEGNRKMAVQGETGLYFPPGDALALGRAIERLATDAADRQRMGRAGAAYVAAHYSVESSVIEMKELFEKAITN
jgi:glycosyltransferase involved in cell wall biosynthesis